MGKNERLMGDPDEIDFKPKARGGKENNDYHKKNRGSKPTEKPQGSGRLAYLYGSGDPTPETPQEKMLRMLHAQNPETTSPFPQAGVSQNTLRQTLKSKRPKQ